MEHAPFDVERLREFLLGMTNKRSILEKGSLQPDVVPFVRIPAAGGATKNSSASGAQVIDGSLLFQSSLSQYLQRAVRAIPTSLH